MDGTGNFISSCSDAPNYNDYALPPSELICSRVVENAEITHPDPYKKEYMVASRMIDSAIAHTNLSLSLVRRRFELAQQGLDSIMHVQSVSKDKNGVITELFTTHGDNILEQGRLSYHIAARMLDASMGCFIHRALYKDTPLPAEVMEETHRGYMAILRDFDTGGLYADHLSLVAHRLTEVISLGVLSRSQRADGFPQPALHREEASRTAVYNRDGGIFTHAPAKLVTPISIKNSDYRHRGSGQRMSEIQDSNEVALIIFQDMVSFTRFGSEPILHHVVPETPTNHIDDQPFPYEEFDPDFSDRKHYIRWSAGGNHHMDLDDEPFTYVQDLSGSDENSLMKALLAEAAGDDLTRHQLNLLNGASHYLNAIVRQVA